MRWILLAIIMAVFGLLAIGFEWPTIERRTDHWFIRWQRYGVIIADPDGYFDPCDWKIWTGVMILKKPANYEPGMSVPIVFKCFYKEWEIERR